MKSRDDWIGRLNRGAVAGEKTRDKLADFYSFDYNDVDDTEILKYLPDLKQRMGL